MANDKNFAYHGKTTPQIIDVYPLLLGGIYAEAKVSIYTAFI